MDSGLGLRKLDAVIQVVWPQERRQGTGKRECIGCLGTVCWVLGCGPSLRL